MGATTNTLRLGRSSDDAHYEIDYVFVTEMTVSVGKYAELCFLNVESHTDSNICSANDSDEIRIVGLKIV